MIKMYTQEYTETLIQNYLKRKGGIHFFGLNILKNLYLKQKWNWTSMKHVYNQYKDGNKFGPI
jgi:hypothetical protein